MSCTSYNILLDLLVVENEIIHDEHFDTQSNFMVMFSVFSIKKNRYGVGRDFSCQMNDITTGEHHIGGR